MTFEHPCLSTSVCPSPTSTPSRLRCCLPVPVILLFVLSPVSSMCVPPAILVFYDLLTLRKTSKETNERNKTAEKAQRQLVPGLQNSAQRLARPRIHLSVFNIRAWTPHLIPCSADCLYTPLRSCVGPPLCGAARKLLSYLFAYAAIPGYVSLCAFHVSVSMPLCLRFCAFLLTYVCRFCVSVFRLSLSSALLSLTLNCCMPMTLVTCICSPLSIRLLLFTQFC